MLKQENPIKSSDSLKKKKNLKGHENRKGTCWEEVFSQSMRGIRVSNSEYDWDI